MNLRRSLKRFLADPSLGVLPLLRAWRRAGAAGKRLHVFIMCGGLGDIVAADPAIRALIQPDEYVVVLARPNYVSAFGWNPYVQQALRVEAYAQAVILKTVMFWVRWTNLHVHGHVCNVFKIPIKNRNAAGVTAQNYYHHGTLSAVYALTACGRVLAAMPQVYPDPDFDADAYLAAAFTAAAAPLLILHTEATEPVRSWPAAHLREAAKLILASTDMNILEMGLAPHLPAGGRVHGPGAQLSLPQQFALMQKGAVFLGVDSGFAHIALALRLPSVLMLGAYKDFGDYLPWTLAPDDRLLRADGDLGGVAPAVAVQAVEDLIANAESVVHT